MITSEDFLKEFEAGRLLISKGKKEYTRQEVILAMETYYSKRITMLFQEHMRRKKKW